MSETSDKIRKLFKAGDDIRDAGLKEPEDVEKYLDIRYGTEDPMQVMDVYRPAGREGLLPVIVSVHGGGWVYGDKERYRFYCMDLARRGFVVVNFSYRLAPEHKFPAPLEDTNLVFEWMAEHGKAYSMDLDKVFAVGDSAGGNILSLYLAACTNASFKEKWEKECRLQIQDSISVRAAALNCGVYKIENDMGGDTPALMEDYLPGKGTEEEMDMISSISHITGNYPPVFLMTASGDFTQSQALAMAECLMERKVPFLFRFYDNEAHDLKHVFHVDMKCPQAEICNDETCRFFIEILNRR